MRKPLLPVVLGVALVVVAGCSDEGGLTPSADGADTPVDLQDPTGAGLRASCMTASGYEFFTDELIEEWSSIYTGILETTAPEGCSYYAYGLVDVNGSTVAIGVVDTHVDASSCSPTTPLSLLSFAGNAVAPAMNALNSASIYNCQLSSYGSTGSIWSFCYLDSGNLEHFATVFYNYSPGTSSSPGPPWDPAILGDPDESLGGDG